MAPPRRYWVKLKVPKTVLQKLPVFEPPVSKSRLKKLAQDDKKESKTGSPQPDFNHKINSGLKESSTSGLMMNTVGQVKLDKSGKPAKKWTKKPVLFKTFSGYTVKYVNWRK